MNQRLRAGGVDVENVYQTWTDMAVAASWGQDAPGARIRTDC